MFADGDFVDDQYCYAVRKGGMIYPEHNAEYLLECIENLASKGVDTSEIESKLTFHLK